MKLIQEADSFLSRISPPFKWNPKIHYHSHKRTPLHPAQSYANTMLTRCVFINFEYYHTIYFQVSQVVSYLHSVFYLKSPIPTDNLFLSAPRGHSTARGNHLMCYLIFMWCFDYRWTYGPGSDAHGDRVWGIDPRTSPGFPPAAPSP
jgi:hypothetical protein